MMSIYLVDMSDKETRNFPLNALIKRAVEQKKGRIKVYYKVFERREYVILFLYLLHHPDYPYSIAKAFNERIKGKRQNKSKSFPRSLTRGSRVAALLKEMEKAKVVESHKEKAGKKERIYYNIVPAVLSQEAKINLTDREEIVFSTYKYSELVENYVEIIQAISPDKARCIEKINSFRKYDYLTILAYFKNLLAEIEMLYSPKARIKSPFLKKEELSKIKETTGVEVYEFIILLLRDYIIFLDSLITSSIYEERGLINLTFFGSTSEGDQDTSDA